MECNVLKDLDASVCFRVPVRTTLEDRCFDATYQCMPALGYTKMFEQMLAASPKVEVILRTDYRNILSQCLCNHLVYTGAIDEFFNCVYGGLPYRSLAFEYEHLSSHILGSEFCLPTVMVNYPDSDYIFIRIFEPKRITGQKCVGSTTIVREYPADYIFGREPYYPFPPQTRRHCTPSIKS